ncbi:MAG: hypothetical protein WB770_02125 [Acidimicrobiales bacterium]
MTPSIVATVGELKAIGPTVSVHVGAGNEGADDADEVSADADVATSALAAQTKSAPTLESARR